MPKTRKNGFRPLLKHDVIPEEPVEEFPPMLHFRQWAYDFKLPRGINKAVAEFAPEILLNSVDWETCKTVGDFRQTFEACQFRRLMELSNDIEKGLVIGACDNPITLEKFLLCKKNRKFTKSPLLHFLLDVNFERCLWALSDTARCIPRWNNVSQTTDRTYGFLHVVDYYNDGDRAKLEWTATPEQISQWWAPQYFRRTRPVPKNAAVVASK